MVVISSVPSIWSVLPELFFLESYVILFYHSTLNLKAGFSRHLLKPSLFFRDINYDAPPLSVEIPIIS
jgi:hypothetical protein